MDTLQEGLQCYFMQTLLWPKTSVQYMTYSGVAYNPNTAKSVLISERTQADTGQVAVCDAISGQSGSVGAQSGQSS